MNVNRVQQASRWLGGICGLCMVALPCILIFGLASGSYDAEAIRTEFSDIPVSSHLPALTVVGLVATKVVLLMLLLYVLWQMQRLFLGYSRGNVLTYESARHLIRAGAALLLLALADVVVGAVQVLLLTFHNPEGQRQVSIDVTEQEIGFVLAGGLLMVVGWALVEAARHAEENREFI